MRKGILWGVGAWLIGTAPISAQTAPTAKEVNALPSASVAAPTAPTPVAPQSPPNLLGAPVQPDLAAACNNCNGNCTSPYRIWGSSEFLLWWVKGTPIPVPLVTTGDPALSAAAGTNLSGAIGQPGTQVLFGNQNMNFKGIPGFRLMLGAWLDDEQRIGIEGGGFLLSQRSNQYSAASGSTGNPPFYVPAFSVDQGGERALPVGDPLQGFAGNVSVTSTLQLWGTQLNGLFSVWRQPGLQVSMIGGFRYMDLRENLQMNTTVNDLIFANTTQATDFFGTRNQFYGGQLGARINWQRDRFYLNLTGMVALGETHQVVNIQGDISQVAQPGGLAATPGTFPGGIFAQPSNIGQRSANEFGVIPTLDLKVGYQFTPRMSGFIGYNYLYWNQVVRPGDQIDRNINQTQSQVFSNGTLVGPAAPHPLFNRTDFWAHGVSFGLQFRF